MLYDTDGNYHLEGLTHDETQDLQHWSRWGSDGYPIQKVGREWIVKHFPTTFKTKREATERWEAYIDVLIEKKGLLDRLRAED